MTNENAEAGESGDPLQPASTHHSALCTLHSPARLLEVALLFLRLGFTAFGGPAVHTAMMEDEVVRRRRWLDRQHFLDLVAALNFIPGPNSTELAIHLGLIRAGHRGLIVAGVCFIAPAVLIVLPLAWAYATYGRVPRVDGAMRGIGAAVVAVVAVAGWRFATTGIKDRFTLAIAIATLPAEYLLRKHTQLQSELVILAGAALAGVMWYAPPKMLALQLIPLPLAGFAPTTVPSPSPTLLQVALFFLKVGCTLFGSGYVLVSYLRTGLVEQNPWLTERQLIDAVAVGQVTPGPLLTTATFIGYLLAYKTFGTVTGGIAGGLVATAAIFLPSFLLVACFGRVLPRLRNNRYARAALDGMNAAVVALILIVAARFAYALHGDPLGIAIAVVALCGLLIWDLNATWLIGAAAAAGALAGPLAESR